MSSRLFSAGLAMVKDLEYEIMTGDGTLTRYSVPKDKHNTIGVSWDADYSGVACCCARHCDPDGEQDVILLRVFFDGKDRGIYRCLRDWRPHWRGEQV